MRLLAIPAGSPTEPLPHERRAALVADELVGDAYYGVAVGTDEVTTIGRADIYGRIVSNFLWDYDVPATLTLFQLDGDGSEAHWTDTGVTVELP